MKKLVLMLAILFFMPQHACADYIFIWLRDDTGLTAEKDKGVAKRGEVISITPDTAPPSELEKQHFLIIQVDLTEQEKSDLMEEWGNQWEDRENYRGKRRLFDVDALTGDVGRSKGLVPGKAVGLQRKNIINRVRLKSQADLVRYQKLRRSRYAGRQLERFMRWIDPTTHAYAETITTICPTSCDYTTIANWETTEGAGATLSEVKTGNVKDDDGSFNCGNASIDGQTTSASAYMRLYSAPGERHAGVESDGSSGNGSLLIADGGNNSCINANDEYTRIEWLQIKGDASAGYQVLSAVGSDAGPAVFANLIVRDETISRAAFRNYNGKSIIQNTLVYDVPGGTGDPCVFSEQGTGNVKVYNSTFVNCGDIGIDRANVGSTLDIENSVVCGSGTTDYANDLTSADQVISCDATACDNGGTSTVDCIESATASALFENTTTHDYTPKSGSDLIDFGNDLVTTPTDVEIDLNGRDRDAQGDTWDVGALELVASAATSQVITISKQIRRAFYALP